MCRYATRIRYTLLPSYRQWAVFVFFLSFGDFTKQFRLILRSSSCEDDDGAKIFKLIHTEKASGPARETRVERKMDMIEHTTVRTNGINMHVASIGSGPDTVLFLHGFPELWYLPLGFYYSLQCPIYVSLW